MKRLLLAPCIVLPVLSLLLYNVRLGRSGDRGKVGGNSVGNATFSKAGALEYAVWSELLKQFVADRKEVLVLQTPSIHPKKDGLAEFAADVPDPIARIAPEAFRSSVGKLNAPAIQFEPRLHVPVEYKIVPRNQIWDLFVRTHGDWQLFRRAFPDAGGYIRLSPVGLNDQATQAFGHFENHCGELCGSGGYYVMEKGKDGWKLTKYKRVWIS